MAAICATDVMLTFRLRTQEWIQDLIAEGNTREIQTWLVK